MTLQKLMRTLAAIGRHRTVLFVVTVVLSALVLAGLTTFASFDEVKTWALGWLVFVVWFAPWLVLVYKAGGCAQPDRVCPFADLSLYAALGALILVPVSLLACISVWLVEWHAHFKLGVCARPLYVVIEGFKCPCVTFTACIGTWLICATGSLVAAVIRRIRRKHRVQWACRVGGSVLVAVIAIIIAALVLACAFVIGVATDPNSGFGK